MKLSIIAIAFACVVVAASPELDSARDRQDRAALEQLAAQAAAAEQKAANDAGAHYHAALAWSYVAEVAQEQHDKGGVKRAAEAGIHSAEKAVAMKPESAEYHRLLGTLYGQIVPVNVLAGLSYGKKAQDEVNKAIALDGKLAAAYVSRGVGNYYLPAGFGGGPDVAIRDFQKAIELDPKSSEAYLWLGLTQRKANRNAEARQSFSKSLRVKPEPALDQAATREDSRELMSERAALAGAICALTLLSFFQFPGHTYLQADSQIYVPILEHIWNPDVLANDPIVTERHVAFTLYDELAVGLRKLTGLSFEQVLEGAQIVFRAAGILGFYLIASSAGLSVGPSLLVAAMVALGATIGGPSVLSFEYEPTPRAFAVPLIFLAVGCVAQGRYLAGTLAGSAAFLLHAPATYSFWAVYVVTLIVPIDRSRKLRGLAVLAVAALALWLSSRAQGGGAQTAMFLTRVEPGQEILQKMRASYNWVSLWWQQWIPHYAVLCAVTAIALVRLRKIIPASLFPYTIGLPLIGALSVPAAYLLLDKMKLALLPQFQPMRALLFITVMAALLAGDRGLLCRKANPLWRSLPVAGGSLLDPGEYQGDRDSFLSSNCRDRWACDAGPCCSTARIAWPSMGRAPRGGRCLLRYSDAGRRSQLSGATHRRPDSARPLGACVYFEIVRISVPGCKTGFAARDFSRGVSPDGLCRLESRWSSELFQRIRRTMDQPMAGHDAAAILVCRLRPSGKAGNRLHRSKAGT